MAVWHYNLALVPAEPAKQLASVPTDELVASFATADGADFSAMWQLVAQPVDEVVATVSRFLKLVPGAATREKVFGSTDRYQMVIRENGGLVSDVVAKIDVHAAREIPRILSEIAAIAKRHELVGMSEEHGLIQPAETAQILRCISQSRAVRYLRNPDDYLQHIHDTYQLPDPQPFYVPLDGVIGEDEDDESGGEPDASTG